MFVATKQVLEATTIEHVLSCKIDGQTHLLCFKGRLLEIYRIHEESFPRTLPASGGAQNTNNKTRPIFINQQSFTSNIQSLAMGKDILVIGWGKGRWSLYEWSSVFCEFVVVSLHAFESSGGGNDDCIDNALVAIDGDDRCVAMQIDSNTFALLDLQYTTDDAAVEESGEDGNHAKSSKYRNNRINYSHHHSFMRKESQILKWSDLLDDGQSENGRGGIRNVIDFKFLSPTHLSPTLAILCEGMQPTWPYLQAIRKDTKAIYTVSLGTPTICLSAHVGLPSDCTKIASIVGDGGCIISGANELFWFDGGRIVGTLMLSLYSCSSMKGGLKKNSIGGSGAGSSIVAIDEEEFLMVDDGGRWWRGGLRDGGGAGMGGTGTIDINSIKAPPTLDKSPDDSAKDEQLGPIKQLILIDSLLVVLPWIGDLMICCSMAQKDTTNSSPTATNSNPQKTDNSENGNEIANIAQSDEMELDDIYKEDGDGSIDLMIAGGAEKGKNVCEWKAMYSLSSMGAPSSFTLCDPSLPPAKLDSSAITQDGEGDGCEESNKRQGHHHSVAFASGSHSSCSLALFTPILPLWRQQIISHKVKPSVLRAFNPSHSSLTRLILSTHTSTSTHAQTKEVLQQQQQPKQVYTMAATICAEGNIQITSNQVFVDGEPLALAIGRNHGDHDAYASIVDASILSSGADDKDASTWIALLWDNQRIDVWRINTENKSEEFVERIQNASCFQLMRNERAGEDSGAEALLCWCQSEIDSKASPSSTSFKIKCLSSNQILFATRDIEKLSVLYPNMATASIDTSASPSNDNNSSNQSSPLLDDVISISNVMVRVRYGIFYCMFCVEGQGLFTYRCAGAYPWSHLVKCKNPAIMSNSLVITDTCHLPDFTVIATENDGTLFWILDPVSAQPRLYRNPKITFKSVNRTAIDSNSDDSTNNAFITLTNDHQCAIYAPSTAYSLTHSWPFKRAHLWGHSCLHLAHHSPSNSIVASHVQFLPFTLQPDEYSQISDNPQSSTGPLDTLPVQGRYGIRLLDSNSFVTLDTPTDDGVEVGVRAHNIEWIDDTIVFEENEVITCMKSLSLNTKQTSSGKSSFIVVGTSTNLGEDRPSRGKIRIFDIVTLVPDPCAPHRNRRLKELVAVGQKGPVTAICAVNGNLLVSIGGKLVMHSFDDNSALTGIAFLDHGLYATQLTAIKSFFVATDFCRSLSLHVHQEKPSVIVNLSSDCGGGGSVGGRRLDGCGYLRDGGALLLAVHGEAGMVSLVIVYNPESGISLREKSLFTFDSQSIVGTAPALLPNTHSEGVVAAGGGGEGDDSRQASIVVTGCGSMHAIYPVPERLFRSLYPSLTKLVSNTPQSSPVDWKRSCLDCSLLMDGLRRLPLRARQYLATDLLGLKADELVQLCAETCRPIDTLFSCN